MGLKDLARRVRDDVVPRERLRRAHRDALVGSGVKIIGDVSRIHLASRVTVHGPTVLSVEDGGGLIGSLLRIGEGTYVGEFNNLRCAGAPVTIGAGCLISQLITMVGSNHGTAVGRSIASQPWEGEGIVVGDDVWIGAGVTLLPGTRLGDGVIVAANSVVRGEVSPNSIVGGSPARELGARRPDAVSSDGMKP